MVKSRLGLITVILIAICCAASYVVVTSTATTQIPGGHMSSNDPKEPNKSATTTPRFYEIGTKQLFGGVGSILIEGYSTDRRLPDGRRVYSDGPYGGPVVDENGVWISKLIPYGPDQGPMLLRRTGPFMPPITLPAPLTGTCVVSADFKAKIEAAGLTHSPIRYIAVEKHHICEFRWDLWGRNNEDPDEWPDGDEPEDYIDNRPHSETAAMGLGDIYEMIVPVGAQYRSVKSPTEIVGKTFLVASTWDGSHLFRAANQINPHYFDLVCDEIGKKWIEDNAGGFVEFQALGTVP